MSLRTGVVAHLFPRLFVLLAVSGAIALVACGSNNDAALADLAEGCAINSDCNAPLVCAFKECHDKCDSSRDCPDGQLCIASDKPFHVCQLPDETKCTTNSECPTGEICGIDDHCRDACSSNRDCLPTQYCTAGACADTGNPPVAVVDAATTVTPGTPCRHNSDCESPLVCENALCDFQCVTARDCDDGLACMGNLCVAPDGGMSVSDGSGDDASSKDATVSDSSLEIPDAAYRIPDGAPANYGEECALSSDCPAGLYCTNARCVYQCVDAFDCNTGAGQCCSPLHVCVTGSACTVTVLDAGMSDAGSGKLCGSDLDCQDGVFCDGYERCNAGRCANSKPACDDGNPCTADSCNETGGSCTHAATGPMDQDGDGHFAIACGGGADDCDDTNANVHPGATEICDFLDDNCNGIVDEGIWANGSIVTLNGSAGSGISNAPTYAPSLGRLTDGSFVAVGYNVGQSGAGFWHVATDLKSADTGHNFGAQPNGVGASYFGFATDGVDALYTQTTGSTHSALYTLLGTGTQNGTVISTATADTAYADSNGMVTWVPTLNHYAFVYSDAHLVGTSNEPYSNLFATAVTSAGVRSGDHLLLPSSQAEIPDTNNSLTNANNGYPTRIQMSTNGTSVLVAWTENTTSKVRYALFDAGLTALTAGPFDLTGTDQVLAVASLSLGSTYILATSDAAETNNRLLVVDATGGAVGATRALATTASACRANVHLAALGPGVAVSLNNGGGLEFGYIPANLSSDIGFTIVQATSYGGGSIAPIDAKHAGLAWANGSSCQVTMMTCGQ